VAIAAGAGLVKRLLTWVARLTADCDRLAEACARMERVTGVADDSRPVRTRNSAQDCEAPSGLAIAQVPPPIRRVRPFDAIRSRRESLFQPAVRRLAVAVARLVLKGVRQVPAQFTVDQTHNFHRLLEVRRTEPQPTERMTGLNPQYSLLKDPVRSRAIVSSTRAPLTGPGINPPCA
jgi:hypothetical protein